MVTVSGSIHTQQKAHLHIIIIYYIMVVVSTHVYSMVCTVVGTRHSSIIIFYMISTVAPASQLGTSPGFLPGADIPLTIPATD